MKSMYTIPICIPRGCLFADCLPSRSRIGDLPASLNDPSNPVSSSQGVEKDELAPAEIPKTTSVSRPSVVHRRSLSNPIARMQSQSELPPLESNTQVPTSPAIRALEIPPTPELKNASLETPTTATTAQLPTPVYSVIMSLPPESQNGLHNMHEMKASMQHINEDRSLIELDSIHGQEHQHEPTIDPKTIFVGGLETLGPQPWNEERLRSIFEKYGIITEVHIVVPSMLRLIPINNGNLPSSITSDEEDGFCVYHV